MVCRLARTQQLGRQVEQDINYREATVWDAMYITVLWTRMMEEVKVPNRNATNGEQERFFLKLMVKIKDKSSYVMVAEKEKKLIGFVTSYLYYCDCGTSDLICHCDNIYINKEHRDGQTLDKFIDSVINWGKTNKATEVEFLSVYKSELLKVWEHKGYMPKQVIYHKEI